jgi:TetR/AcrR family transcriptional regulator, transcriptional repressor for nem operon
MVGVMARPREFDEDAALDAAMRCFWHRGYQATSIKALIEGTGLCGASLYNAFGDKRALFGKALDRYVEGSIAERIARCEALPPRDALAAFFADVVARSLADTDRKGCMLVNAALDTTADDPGIRNVVAGMLVRIETFFRTQIEAGQADGTISTALSSPRLAAHLLGVLLGMRVLARIRPEATLLNGVVDTAFVLLGAPAPVASRSPSAMCIPPPSATSRR